MKEELCAADIARVQAARPIAIRQALAVDTDVVVGCATGCLEVTQLFTHLLHGTLPFIHNTHLRTLQLLSVVWRQHRALKKKGKITRIFSS